MFSGRSERDISRHKFGTRSLTRCTGPPCVTSAHAASRCWGSLAPNSLLPQYPWPVFKPGPKEFSKGDSTLVFNFSTSSSRSLCLLCRFSGKAPWKSLGKLPLGGYIDLHALRINRSPTITNSSCGPGSPVSALKRELTADVQGLDS